ncbi:MAG: ImmA/IrrE family metallo-endopeptidase [Solirubrobacterales bacterium]|nr:ImmA/IrrE family metallo-endopeptidase [Solirubrobacterales bacterium]
MPEYIWDGETLPVPVEDIVDSVYGLLVRDVDDMSAAPGAPPASAGHLSGLLLTGPGEIWVDRAEGIKWPGRRRFTISHELGHHILHSTGGQPLFCRGTVIDEAPEVLAAVTKKRKPKVPLIETEADIFAASILMPSHLMKTQYERCDGEIERLMKDFKCSQKAITRRVLHVVPRDRRRPRRPA